MCGAAALADFAAHGYSKVGAQPVFITGA